MIRPISYFIYDSIEVAHDVDQRCGGDHLIVSTMPSIAAFIRELVSEDKYSSGFSDRIEERVQQMNVAQLQGLHAVLKQNMKSAKTELWRTANQTIIDRIAAELKAKEKEFQKEQKLVEDYRIQQRQKVERMRAAKKEEIRVKEMIEDKARSEAAKEVMDKEYARQNEERFVIMRRVFEAEEARNKWWIRIAVIYVLLVAGIIATISVIMNFPIYITIGGIFVVTCGAVYAAYRCHLWTIIKPIVMPQELLDSQIEQRQETLVKQAFSVLREKERRYEEQVKKDKLDKKRRKAEKKEKQRLEAMLMEQQRLEKIAMAKEVIAREKSSQGGSYKASQSNNSVASDDQSSFALQSLVEDDEESIEQIALHDENKTDFTHEIAPGKDDGIHWNGQEGNYGVPEINEFGVDTDDYEETDGERDELLGELVDELLVQSREQAGPLQEEFRNDEESQTSVQPNGDGEESVVTIFTTSVQEEVQGINNIYRKKPQPNIGNSNIQQIPGGKGKIKFAVIDQAPSEFESVDDKV